MHFDPVASQDPASVSNSRIATDDDYIGREIEREDEAAPRNAREGLPKAFRMRHGKHYVEQLMGDAPIRTVLEIAISDIEAPPHDPADLSELERSIRELGVLEPLLVGQQGCSYRVIAGMNRLRAARTAGLRSVPCLVHEVDDEMLKNMREAAARRAVPSPLPEAAPIEPSDQSGAAESAHVGALPPAFGEVTAGLNFVSALMPAIDAAGEDRFRWSVLTDLAGVELQRARAVASAAEVLASQPAIARSEVRSGDLIDSVIQAVSAEARLRAATLRVDVPEPDYCIALDSRLTGTAITGLVRSLLSLATAGATLGIAMKGTAVRPALIVELTMSGLDLSAEAVRRFFDGDWREHPAGASGGLMLAAAARIARLHGGRTDIRLPAPRSCMVTFVIPRFLGN